jgi:hypothetical protein
MNNITDIYMNNLVFIDPGLTDINTFIDGLSANTDHIIYDLSGSYATPTNITHLGFVYHYTGHPRFPFFNNKDTLSEDDLALVANHFFSQSFIDYITAAKLANPNLIIDLLTCNVYDQTFIDQINEVESIVGITIRYSTDKIGHVKGANYIQESHDVDIKSIYFTSLIDNWNYTLNTGIYIDKLPSIFTLVEGVYYLKKNIEWTTADIPEITAVTDFIILRANEIVDGNGYTMHYPTTDLSGNTSFKGFFSTNDASVTSISNAPIIRNLKVTWAPSSTTEASGALGFWGAIVRREQSYFKVQNCRSEGTLAGQCGGICGYGSGASNGTFEVENCLFAGTGGFSTGNSGCGGIVGGFSGGLNCVVRDCLSSGTNIAINSGCIVGTRFGLGINCSGTTMLIERCYSTGNIGQFGGGIAGFGCGQGALSCVIQNCYSIGTIPSFSGGIAGTNPGLKEAANATSYCEVINCYALGLPGTDSGAIIGNSSVSLTYGTRIVTRCVGQLRIIGTTTTATQTSNSTTLGDLTGTIYTGWSGSIWVATTANYPRLIPFTTSPWGTYSTHDVAATLSFDLTTIAPNMFVYTHPSCSLFLFVIDKTDTNNHLLHLYGNTGTNWGLITTYNETALSVTDLDFDKVCFYYDTITNYICLCLNTMLDANTKHVYTILAEAPYTLTKLTITPALEADSYINDLYFDGTYIYLVGGDRSGTLGGTGRANGDDAYLAIVKTTGAELNETIYQGTVGTQNHVALKINKRATNNDYFILTGTDDGGNLRNSFIQEYTITIASDVVSITSPLQTSVNAYTQYKYDILGDSAGFYTNQAYPVDFLLNSSGIIVFDQVFHASGGTQMAYYKNGLTRYGYDGLTRNGYRVNIMQNYVGQASLSYNNDQIYREEPVTLIETGEFIYGFSNMVNSQLYNNPVLYPMFVTVPIDQINFNLYTNTQITNVRKIKIIPGGLATLTFSDIEAFDESDLNLIHEGLSFSSSTVFNDDTATFGPARAADGSTITYYKANSTDLGNFWQVDFGTSKTVTQIKLYNRTDAEQDNLIGCSVQLLDASDNILWQQVISTNDAVHEFNVGQLNTTFTNNTFLTVLDSVITVYKMDFNMNVIGVNFLRIYTGSSAEKVNSVVTDGINFYISAYTDSPNVLLIENDTLVNQPLANVDTDALLTRSIYVNVGETVRDFRVVCPGIDQTNFFLAKQVQFNNALYDLNILVNQTYMRHVAFPANAWDPVLNSNGSIINGSAAGFREFGNRILEITAFNLFGNARSSVMFDETQFTGNAAGGNAETANGLYTRIANELNTMIVSERNNIFLQYEGFKTDELDYFSNAWQDLNFANSSVFFVVNMGGTIGGDPRFNGAYDYKMMVEILLL